MAHESINQLVAMNQALFDSAIKVLARIKIAHQEKCKAI